MFVFMYLLIFSDLLTLHVIIICTAQCSLSYFDPTKKYIYKRKEIELKLQHVG